MSPLRIGVVGVGHLGYHHARLYASFDNVELVGVADTNLERAHKVAAEFCPGHAYASIDELLEQQPHAVSVAVPTTHHHDTVLTLLRAGVDVCVEKPIAGHLDDAETMVSTAKEMDRILQVGHVERFNGAVVALFETSRHPRFIECHRLSPYPMRGADVSVVLDLMIHDLEIVLALERSRVISVDAIGVSVFSTSEDIANARIRFESGAVANITSSRVSMDRMRKIRIFEEDAYMSTDYSEQEVRVYRKKPGVLDAGASPMDSITVEMLPVKREEPLQQELLSFVDCVYNRKRPIVSGEDALSALRLAQQIIDSIRVNP